MKQLRKDLHALIHDNNETWVDEIKRARESEDGLDLLKIIPVISESINKRFDKLMDEFEVRMTGTEKEVTKKKKGWF